MTSNLYWDLISAQPRFLSLVQIHTVSIHVFLFVMNPTIPSLTFDDFDLLDLQEPSTGVISGLDKANMQGLTPGPLEDFLSSHFRCRLRRNSTLSQASLFCSDKHPDKALPHSKLFSPASIACSTRLASCAVSVQPVCRHNHPIRHHGNLLMLLWWSQNWSKREG